MAAMHMWLVVQAGTSRLRTTSVTPATRNLKVETIFRNTPQLNISYLPQNST